MIGLLILTAILAAASPTQATPQTPQWHDVVADLVGNYVVGTDLAHGLDTDTVGQGHLPSSDGWPTGPVRVKAPDGTTITVDLPPADGPNAFLLLKGDGSWGALYPPERDGRYPTKVYVVYIATNWWKDGHPYGPVEVTVTGPNGERAEETVTLADWCAPTDLNLKDTVPIPSTVRRITLTGISQGFVTGRWDGNCHLWLFEIDAEELGLDGIEEIRITPQGEGYDGSPPYLWIVEVLCEYPGTGGTTGTTYTPVPSTPEYLQGGTAQAKRTVPAAPRVRIDKLALLEFSFLVMATFMQLAFVSTYDTTGKMDPLAVYGWYLPVLAVPAAVPLLYMGDKDAAVSLMTGAWTAPLVTAAVYTDAVPNPLKPLETRLVTVTVPTDVPLIGGKTFEITEATVIGAVAGLLTAATGFLADLMGLVKPWILYLKVWKAVEEAPEILGRILPFPIGYALGLPVCALSLCGWAPWDPWPVARWLDDP